MTIITLTSSLVIIVQLLSFQNKSTKPPKRLYGLLAAALCGLMMFQILHITHTNLLHSFVTTILAIGVVYHNGNISHLIKEVRKCVKNSLNL